ncbi:serine protease [Hyphococcus flavus]|uniref:Serine protease n=1 Tax=Hyphococcus flavus TaxID=1866326 RepID=A0AAF0CFV7_9PROT|nr:serine protease [Hyphococcus flavus]WDI31498.1 serine protease [Hyphococcus flavus]
MGENQLGGVLGRYLTAIVIIAGIALFISIETARYAEIRRLRSATNTLQEDIQRANEKADAALSAIISPETLSSAQSSVYLIVVNGSARGTAFVLDRDKGLLVTAAHVASELPLQDENASVYILNRSTKVAMKVQTVRLHAGYGAFRTLVEDYQPIRKNSSIYAPQAAPLRDLAFDAAFITVDSADAETGENLLGPNFSLAPEDHLLGLEPGAPIAVIGYPYDTLDDGFAPDSAIPRIERGVISAITPPLDNVAEAQNPVTANLIIHRLSTAGGSSGSPIINAAGEVIGIHTHGIESASSNADGAAQRAEVILDLFSSDRETDRLNEVFYPSWRRLLSYWARAEDSLPWSFYMEYARPDETPPPQVREFQIDNSTPFTRDLIRQDFEPETETKRVEASDIDLAKISDEDGDTGKLRESSSFLLNEKGEYAELWRSVDRSRENVLFAFDYSLRSKRGYCPLKTYWRKKGETRLQATPFRASFELHLPPTQEANTEEYHIVIQRPAGCDPISKEFFFGSISWTGAEDPLTTASLSSNQTSRNEDAKHEFYSRVSEVQSRIGKFIKCLPPINDATSGCTAPEYVELASREDMARYLLTQSQNEN